MAETAYAPQFEVEHSYAGFSVVARPGVGLGDAATTVDQVFKSKEDAERWIAEEGKSWAETICTLPGEAGVKHRSL